MNSVNIDDFYEYNLISNMNAIDNDIYFNLTNISRENNCYEMSIAKLEDMNFKKITTNCGGGFIFHNDAIYFKDARTKQEKEKQASGVPYSSIYKLDLNGGEAYRYFDVDSNVTPVKIEDDYIVMLEHYDQCYDGFLDASDQERKLMIERAAEQSDYFKFDEIPFWINGMGVTNKKRNRLAVYDLKKSSLKVVTDKFTDVRIQDVKDDKVLYIANRFVNCMKQVNDLFIYDIKSTQTVKVNPHDGYNYSFAKFAGDKIFVGGSDMKKYGFNQNPTFLLCDYEGKIITEKNYDISTWISLDTDVRYGIGKNMIVHNDELYFLSAYKYNVDLFKLDLNLNLIKLTNFEGSVDGIEFIGDKIYLIALKDQLLQEIYRLESDGSLTAISKINCANDGKYVSKPEKINWSENDFEYDGFVLLPENFDHNKKYPAILEIHGGPKNSFGSVFCHEMQYFASKGYVVMFFNPRGSDGYGDDFANIYGKFGDVDYKDFMHFVDLVLEKYKNIDEDNLFVTGGSYGGYMTNWIVGNNNRFKAAASRCSVVNWITMCGTGDISYYFVPDQTKADIWENPEKMWDQSPLKHANKVKTPTLFLHSDNDYRCYIAEGLQMFTALKMHGVDSEFIWFKNENHDLSRTGKPSNRIKRLNEIINWFDKYNSIR